MKNTLIDLSGKIDPSKINALHTLKKVADSLDIPFFIIGASARDFILEHQFNIRSPRATQDIDLGVNVEDWDRYQFLKDSLLKTGKASLTTRKHRFLVQEVLVDIIPFGSIADENMKISWPPEHETFMSMFGFKEAYEHSITVRLNEDPDLEVKIPTLAGLALMKIISWQDDRISRGKDAEDLLFIMNNYENAGNEERLYGDELSVLEEENFVSPLAGIRLLGRDMAKIANQETTEIVKSLLENETNDQSDYKLVNAMKSSYFTFDERLLYLEKLKQGFTEGANKNTK